MNLEEERKLVDRAVARICNALDPIERTKCYRCKERMFNVTEHTGSYLWCAQCNQKEFSV